MAGKDMDVKMHSIDSVPDDNEHDSPKRRKLALRLHRCRFPDWTPSAISALALSPPSFNTALLGFGGESAERGVLAVARGSGDVELMCWGGHQGWIAWRTLPSSFAPFSSMSSSKRPTSLLSHILFTHQTSLSAADLALYADDLPGATREIARLQREGVRLFGVGGVASELVEWEWGGPGGSSEVGRVKSNLPTLPPIFALAASRSSSHLAVACEDSSIRILNIMDEALEVISRIEVGGPGKVRALSLAWGVPVAPNDDEESDSDAEVPLPKHFRTPHTPTLLAGCSNSTLTLYTATSSQSTAWSASQRMTVDKHPGEPTVVWAVAILSDSTLVSADSMGNVKFWDSKTGTQRQSFHASKADILTIAVGPTGKTLFVSGVDQKTTEFHLAPIGSSPRWVLSSSRRLHAHDVRSLVISPPFCLPLPFPPPSTSTPRSPQVPILTSGGLDLSLVLVAASSAPSSLPNPISGTQSTEFETTTHRKASYVPQRARPVSIASNGILIVRRPRSLGLWSLGGADGWSKVLEMQLKLQTNLVTSAVSPDGKWVAVSDLYETKLFRLSSKSGAVTPRRQKTFSTTLSAHLPPSLGTGSSALLFTPDSMRLVLSTAFSGAISIVSLPSQGSDERFEVNVFGRSVSGAGRELKPLKTNGVVVNGNGNGAVHDESSEDENDSDAEMEGVQDDAVGRPATVVSLCISSDGKWLASADLARKVAVYDLTQLAHYTTLPTPATVPTAMSFVPGQSAPTLLLALPSNDVLLFSLGTRRFLPFPTTSLETLREPCLGVSFEPPPSVGTEGQGKIHASRRQAQQTPSQVAVLWGSNWVARIDLDGLPAPAAPTNGKRPRNGIAQTDPAKHHVLDVKVTRKYQPLLLFDFVRPGEMVAVERVWTDLAKEAPEAFVRNGEFGT